jgi:hypothetical protein
MEGTQNQNGIKAGKPFFFHENGFSRMNISPSDSIQNEFKLCMYVRRTTCSTLLEWDENKCSIKINISVRNVYVQRSCRNAFDRNSEFYESAKNYLLPQITGYV